MKMELWKKVGAGILSLMLAFIFSVALGQVPPPASRLFLFNNVTPPQPTGPTVSKNAIPDNGATVVAGGAPINVTLQISGFNNPNNDVPVDIVMVYGLTASTNEPGLNAPQTRATDLKKSFPNMEGVLTNLNKDRTEANKVRLGMVVYNSDIKTVSQDFTTNFNDLNNWLNSQTSGGDSNIGEGLQKASDLFSAFKHNNLSRYNTSKKMVVLISDSVQQSGVDPTADSILNQFKTEKIVINTIGFQKVSLGDQIVDGSPPQTGDVNSLWCKDYKTSPIGYFQQKEEFGQNKIYCLAKDGKIAANGQLGYRLNGLAYETGGLYFDLDDPNGQMFSVFNTLMNSQVLKNAGIEITEDYDPNFTFVNSSLTITGAGPVTLVDNATLLDQPNKYLISPASTPYKKIFLISPGTVIDSTSYLNLSFHFNINNSISSIPQQACIERSSSVKWGAITIDPTGNNAEIINSWDQKTLDQKCYTINFSPTNQGDVYFQTQPNFSLQASVAVTANGITGVSGNLAELFNYEFKQKTQSQKVQFKNELKSIVNYLANERPDKVQVASDGKTIDFINDPPASYAGKIFINQTGGTITIKGSNSPGTALAIVNIGGTINFINAPSFCGVAIALSDDNGGGVINSTNNSITIKGSLVADTINMQTGNFTLQPFNKNNYLTKIPGLAPLLNKIYSFYASE
jgi:hypothetical protein